MRCSPWRTETVADALNASASANVNATRNRARAWHIIRGALLCAVVAASGCNQAELVQPPGQQRQRGANGVDPSPSGVDSGAGIPAPGPDSDGTGVGASRSRATEGSAKITIQVQPSDGGAAVEALIRGAKSSVHVMMYLLTNSRVIDALGDVHDAGKEVKVVLNKTFPPGGGDNTSAYRTLQQRGVSVVYAPETFAYSHAKAVIVDRDVALIMTMNLTQTSARNNREYIAADRDPADVAECEALFEADYAGTPEAAPAPGHLVVSPPRRDANREGIHPRDALVSFIDQAKASLDVEVQSLSDTAITRAIVAAHGRSVAVRVVLSGAPGVTPGEAAAMTALKSAGVPVRTLVEPYMHAKAVVVDGRAAYVGSHNFTPTALTRNREIGVVAASTDEAQKVSRTIAADFDAGQAL